MAVFFCAFALLGVVPYNRGTHKMLGSERERY